MAPTGIVYEKTTHTSGPRPGELGVLNELMAQWEDALGTYQAVSQSRSKLITNDPELAEAAQQVLDAEKKATAALLTAQGYVAMPKRPQRRVNAQGYVSIPKRPTNGVGNGAGYVGMPKRPNGRRPRASQYILPRKDYPRAKRRVSATFAVPPPVQDLPSNPRFWNLYSIEKVLGEGGFGTVFKVKRKSDGQVFAVKVLKNFDESTREEVQALRALNGRCGAIKYYGAYLIPSPPQAGTAINERAAILTEFVEGQDLLKWYQEKFAKGVQAEDLRAILKDILEQLVCLHSLGVAHRDIKLENTMIKPDGTAQLIDFGISCALNAKLDMLQCADTDPAGTEVYLAPEILLSDMIDLPAPTYLKSDIWSLGIMMYLLMTGEFLIEDIEDFANVRASLDADFYPEDPQLANLVRQMLTLDPRRRPDAATLLEEL